MPSAHYQSMRRQISQFGRSLLPRDIRKDILELSPRMSVRALSYRILCHAEFESYLEARALEIVRAVDSSWKERGHISRSTLCVLAFSGSEMKRLPDTLRAPPNRKDAEWAALIKPDKRVSDCISEFTYFLRRQNHGIKEENLIAILIRLGVDPEEIDEVLVAEMTDLGVKRGEVAHGGAPGYVTRGVNPRDEYERVQRVSEGLRAIDDSLTKIFKQAR